MFNKKSQGISINYIIIAIIALLVLAIIIFIFRAQIGNVFGVFTRIGQKAGCEAEIATTSIGGLFGKSACTEAEAKEGKEICKGNCVYKCQSDGTLQLIDECEKGCANGKCT
ncbi:hypothetical protein KY331_02015 [Candidatus Woesearchaeota archaeon]|nr:hypothetical protein [Candidatus Woesearchaeota archaeon]